MSNLILFTDNYGWNANEMYIDYLDTVMAYRTMKKQLVCEIRRAFFELESVGNCCRYTFMALSGSLQRTASDSDVQTPVVTK